MFKKDSDIEISYYLIETLKMQKDKKCRMMILSDLHSFIYPKEQSKLISIVSSYKPDIIAMTGDIVDDKVKDTGAYMLAEKVVNIAPTFYVTGNHEFRRNDVPLIKERFAKLGIKVLDNSAQHIKTDSYEMIIAGIDDEEGYRSREVWFSKAEDAFSDLKDKSDFKLLLLHKPHLAKYFLKYGFDLVLSGHTHGGQVRTPFTKRGIYASGQGIFPKITEGRYEIGELTLIVSRGLALQPHLPRLFNPTEICVVDIRGIG